ncbi:MAG: uncharacterized membrane protein YhaH (DUF805 family) [Flavobacteriaceae bacterium]|jgi:uncharacterized membrane protein YhaH (DUF805 family)
MMTFFDGMTTSEQTYWIVALIGTIIFAGIFLMTFVGGGDADMDSDMSDVDADDAGGGFQFFTFKSVTAFFTIFGWTGVTCIDNGLSNIATLLISILAGAAMMAVTSLLFFWMAKLAQSGTLRISNAIGAIGEVYLPIGANRSRSGKVQIKVQGSLRELEAITDADEDLPTKSLVKVTEIVSDELLLVEKLTK